jgi:hypothetical protein
MQTPKTISFLDIENIDMPKEVKNAFRMVMESLQKNHRYIFNDLQIRQVNDNGMAATEGKKPEIVFNIDDDTYYGCTTSGSPATWAALH